MPGHELTDVRPLADGLPSGSSVEEVVQGQQGAVHQAHQPGHGRGRQAVQPQRARVRRAVRPVHAIMCVTCILRLRVPSSLPNLDARAPLACYRYHGICQEWSVLLSHQGLARNWITPHQGRLRDVLQPCLTTTFTASNTRSSEEQLIDDQAAVHLG